MGSGGGNRGDGWRSIPTGSDGDDSGDATRGFLVCTVVAVVAVVAATLDDLGCSDRGATAAEVARDDFTAAAERWALARRRCALGGADFRGGTLASVAAAAAAVAAAFRWWWRWWWWWWWWWSEFAARISPDARVRRTRIPDPSFGFGFGFDCGLGLGVDGDGEGDEEDADVGDERRPTASEASLRRAVPVTPRERPRKPPGAILGDGLASRSWCRLSSPSPSPPPPRPPSLRGDEEDDDDGDGRPRTGTVTSRKADASLSAVAVAAVATVAVADSAAARPRFSEIEWEHDAALRVGRSRSTVRWEIFFFPVVHSLPVCPCDQQQMTAGA